MRKEDEFLAEIFQKIEERQMIKEGEHILAGVSGGADSVCLFHVLLHYQMRVSFSLQVIHVEHGLRGRESEQDAAFVRSLCEREGVSCRIVHVNVKKRVDETGESVEEAARKLRYEAFAQELERTGGRKVALAHNQNDQAETVLFHLIRGSGLRGLGGMLPVRTGFLPESCEGGANGDKNSKGKEYSGESFSGDAFEVIRPLLWSGRSEIEAWLKKEQIPFRLDQTNLSLDYARNRIRLQILPLMETRISAGAVQHIAQAASHLQAAEAYFQSEAARLCEKWVRRLPEGAALSLPEFLKSEEILQSYVLRRVIFEVLAGRGLRDYTSGHIEALKELAKGPCGKALTLPGGLLARRQFNEILFVPDGGAASRKEKEPGSSESEGSCFSGPKHGLCAFVAFPLAKKEDPPEFTQSLTEKFPLVRRREDGEKSLPLACDGVYEFLGKLFFAEYLDDPGDGEKIEEKKYTKWIAYDTINQNVCLRTRQSGDYLVINQEGGRKKLNDYLIDQKVPRTQRDQVVLVAEGSHVLWVVGGRISAFAKVTKEKRKVLKISMMEERHEGTGTGDDLAGRCGEESGAAGGTDQ